MSEHLPITKLTLILSFLSALFCGCANKSPANTDSPTKKEKEIWVYQHEDQEGRGYTVFATELPVNKGILPENFLAIKNRKRSHWNCLLKWEGDVLWFYTPSSNPFASYGSDNGKTNWTIIEEEDFNYFFFEEENGKYIRFSSDCNQPGVLCPGEGEMQIVGDIY